MAASSNKDIVRTDEGNQSVRESLCGKIENSGYVDKIILNIKTKNLQKCVKYIKVM